MANYNDDIEGMDDGNYQEMERTYNSDNNDRLLAQGIRAPDPGDRAVMRSTLPPSLSHTDQAFTDDSGAYHPSMQVDTIGDSYGNPYEKTIDTNQRPMETIDDKLQRAGAPTKGFQSPFEFKVALIKGLREVAQERGMDLESPEGKKWYADNINHGLKNEMPSYMAITPDPKRFIHLDNGNILDPVTGKMIYTAPSVLDPTETAGHNDAIHESLSNQLERAHELRQQGIKPPPLLLGAPDTQQDIQPAPEPVQSETRKTPDTSKLEELASDPNKMAALRGSKHPADIGIVKQIDKMMTQKVKDAGESEKQGQMLDKTFNDLIKKTPAEASGRSLLGTIMQAENKLDRSMKILDQKDMTPQELDMVTGDLAGIIQNGAPHREALERQGYNTLLGRARSIQQYITAHPADATNPQIRDRLKALALDMRKTNQELINKHLQSIELSHPKEIDRNREAWNAYKETWGTSDTQSPSKMDPSQRFLLHKAQAGDTGTFNGVKYVFDGKTAKPL